MRVGVLALQGGFALHARTLARSGFDAIEVRTAEDLRAIDGLVLPGGESTVQLRMLDRHGLTEPLRACVARGVPLLATCAGLILAARAVENPTQRSFGWIDVTVSRNGWGRQSASFEAQDDAGALPLVFIRAPRIVAVGEGTEVLARFRGEPVLVRSGPRVGATFHPECTDDPRVHELAFGRLRACAA